MDVYSYIMTITKDASLSEELTQEVFYRAMKSEFQGKSSEITWLCAIAKNLCTDEFRKRKKEAVYDEEAVDSADNPNRTNMEHSVIAKMENLQIHIALHQLEEPYREVFSLRVFGDLSFKDIGMVFGKTENWARVTYHRGKLKLQEKLENSVDKNGGFI
ncbi:MAG: RNA polymerase sigma factor [Lachnospiraceae bacterium]|nr:RNA polymerase sigma factor [Lachnospiraceae bacterium]